MVCGDVHLNWDDLTLCVAADDNSSGVSAARLVVMRSLKGIPAHTAATTVYVPLVLMVDVDI